MNFVHEAKPKEFAEGLVIKSPESEPQKKHRQQGWNQPELAELAINFASERRQLQQTHHQKSSVAVPEE